MRSLPVKVAELEIEEMFKVADVDNDGKIGYKVNYLTLVIAVMLYNLGFSKDG